MGAFALGYIALNRGEQINALWIVVASVCIYLIAYRFYGLYIAKNVLAVDPTRMTPAVRHNDGLDYVPTDKKVLFGHHFAAIAGAGPLVGPVLAAQMGYLPGMIWLLTSGSRRCGAGFHGAVCFPRRDGRSLVVTGQRRDGTNRRGDSAGGLLYDHGHYRAVLAMIVVKALTHSPWGTCHSFTISAGAVYGDLPALSASGAYWRSVGHRSGIPDFRHYLWRLGAKSPTRAPYFDFTGVRLTADAGGLQFWRAAGAASVVTAGPA